MTHVNEGCVAKEPDVTREIAILNNSVCALSDIVSQLENRLDRIERPVVPTTQEEDQKAEQIVPLAEEIRALRWTLEANTDRLRDILCRCEL